MRACRHWSPVSILTSDPAWLMGGVVGVLTVLTGQRFAYDIAARKRW
jgi:hypothetical protein